MPDLRGCALVPGSAVPFGGKRLPFRRFPEFRYSPVIPGILSDTLHPVWIILFFPPLTPLMFVFLILLSASCPRKKLLGGIWNILGIGHPRSGIPVSRLDEQNLMTSFHDTH